ncbi:hypothetical protein HHI36_020305 [Cryptolaemus montrouzieri]|uniref:Uncharacterized protein n=1 Tax=Cryptolaemus montrouzieri TaxID=559131 RepID=A0ABD2NBJ0_9CUCU
MNNPKPPQLSQSQGSKELNYENKEKEVTLDKVPEKQPETYTEESHLNVGKNDTKQPDEQSVNQEYEHYEADPNQQYGQEYLGEGQYTDQQFDPNQEYDPNYQYDPNTDYQTDQAEYATDSNQQYSTDPNQHYSTDSNPQYAVDPSQQYADPNQTYPVDINQQYAIDPTQQYPADANLPYLDPNQQYAAEASEKLTSGPKQ